MIERVFRYIEMIGVTAVVGAAVFLAYGKTATMAVIYPMWVMVAVDMQIRIWTGLFPSGFPVSNGSPAAIYVRFAACVFAAAAIGVLIGAGLPRAIMTLVAAALSVN